MEKDFDRWNGSKKNIHAAAKRPFYHARKIWWCAVGVNIGNELDGTGKHHDRSVLILRPFNAETFFGVSLIGHPRTGRCFLLSAKLTTARLSPTFRKPASSTPRLIRKIGTVAENTFRELAKAFALTLFPFLQLK